MKEILILANGEPPSREVLKALARNADLVICCDGGLQKAVAAGLEPDIVIGDMDSIGSPVRTHGKGIIRIPGQHDTDLDKALKFLVHSGEIEDARIVVAGASGGRIDFTLYNLHLLERFKDLNLFMVDDRFCVFLVHGRCTVRRLEKDSIVSLLPVIPCKGVSASGLKYPLRNARLVPGGLESISNCLNKASGTVKISVGAGALACFINHRPKKFRVLPDVSRSPISGRR